MRFLIFSAYDAIPSDQTAYTRYAYLAEELVKRSHEVVYVTSSFYHTKKQQRTRQTWLPERDYSGIRLIFLNVPGYKRNVGPGRIFNHYILNRQLKKFLQSLAEKPDLVLAASPPLQTANTLLKWAKKNQVPSVLDIQDLWPEAWQQFIPVKGLLRRWNRLAAENIRLATAVAAVSKDYLPGNKNQTKAFYLATDVSAYNHRPYIKGESIRLVHLGSPQTRSPLPKIIDFIGNKQGTELTIIGLQKEAEHYKKYIQMHGYKNIEVIEWMSPAELQQQLSQFDAAIAVLNTASFSALPNRVFSYFAAGLPVIYNNTTGELHELTSENEAGICVDDMTEDAFLNAVYKAAGFTVEDHSRIRQWAANLFDVKKIYPAYAAWLEGIAKNKGS
jgi:glycosyltransferase involved in cell wall biosynthesis